MVEKNTLYLISQKIIDIEKQIETQGGEVNSTQDDIIAQLAVALSEKVGGVVGWVRQEESFIRDIDDRVTELKSLRDKTIKRVEKFNEYVVNAMDAMGKVKIEGDFDFIRIRKPTKKVDVIDKNKIPLNYINTKTVTTSKPDLTTILKDLKSGKKIDGVKIMDGSRKAEFKSQ